MTKYLHEINANFSNQTHLYSIGKSVQGRELWVLAISKNHPLSSLGKGYRHIKFVANIHGNEPVGKELLLRFIDYLFHSNGLKALDDVFSKVILHFLPSLNPDGFLRSRNIDNIGRENANGYDLNRNFPDYFQSNSYPMQPETLAVINWLNEWPFVSSLSFHGGALVVNYPYDNKPEDVDIGYFAAPDDDIFRNISKVYSLNNPDIFNNLCDDSKNFTDGITNGVDWYPVRGGMQDYNYIFKGVFELTVEISCLHFPPSTLLQTFWDQNKPSLIEFLYSSLKGVSGFILNSQNLPVSNATITLENRKHATYSSLFGEFWRLLLPGNYTLYVRKILLDSYFPHI
ncbi:unnamed protein product [Gordionus sp. m RMFG-2023]